MPLIHGKSQKSFKKNVETEMREHPEPEDRAQNLAIAYAIKRKAQKMADGGQVADPNSPSSMGVPTGVLDAMNISKKAEGGEMKTKKERAIEAFHNRMADGGILEEAKEMYQPAEDIMPSHSDKSDESMVDRIMRKMAGTAADAAVEAMSEGGMVANEDSGESASTPDEMAKAQPNELDDLALRDELEQSYTGANSGDELGNDRLDEDNDDMVARIMKSRAKKDRLPTTR